MTTEPASVLPDALPAQPDWKQAYEEEACKFQQETRRTSEMAALLRRFAKQRCPHHRPGPWARGCEFCDVTSEASELLKLPINGPGHMEMREHNLHSFLSRQNRLDAAVTVGDVLDNFKTDEQQIERKRGLKYQEYLRTFPPHVDTSQ